jgi:hypothetical protein
MATAWQRMRDESRAEYPRSWAQQLKIGDLYTFSLKLIVALALAAATLFIPGLILVMSLREIIG